MSKTLKWIIGLLVFFIFGYFYVYKKAPEIERMVETRVDQNLKNEGLDHVDYEVNGMEVKLTGQLADENELNRAVKACKVCGNNGVDTEGVTFGNIDQYSVVSKFTKATSALILSGLVPSVASKNAILEKARVLFGNNVSDQMKVKDFEGKEVSTFTNLISSSLAYLKNFSSDSSADVNMDRAIYSGTYYDAGLKNDITNNLSSIVNGVNVELPAVSVLEKLVKVDCQKKINDSLAQNKVQFRLNSFEINISSYPLLKGLALTLSQCPSYRIKIEGHTDLTGSAGKNLKLSQNRANAVKNKLIEYGVSTQNIKAIGLGETKPLDRSMNKAAHAKNRRIEIILEGEI